jgi:hypothetical protein
MFKDLRDGARTLLRVKGWTAIVVLSLALSIGANAALFSAINGLFLKTLPVKDPETLVRLRWAGRNQMATSSSDHGFTAKGLFKGRPETRRDRHDRAAVTSLPSGTEVIVLVCGGAGVQSGDGRRPPCVRSASG